MKDKELPVLSIGVKPTTFWLVLLMLCHWLIGDLLQARQRHNKIFLQTWSKMLDRCLLLYISYYWLPWENNAFKFNSKNFLGFKLKCFASPWPDVIWQVDMQIMNNTMNMFWLYYEEFCLQLNFVISEEHHIKKIYTTDVFVGNY